MKAFGVVGVASGLTVTVIVSAAALFESWSRKTQNPGKNRVYLFLGRLVLASLVLGGILSGIHRIMTSLIPPESLIAALVVCAVTGVAFLGLMPVAGRWMGLPEILAFYEKTARRLTSWQKTPPQT
jgi:putative peptidoglycan lipid II flippase